MELDDTDLAISEYRQILDVEPYNCKALSGLEEAYTKLDVVDKKNEITKLIQKHCVNADNN